MRGRWIDWVIDEDSLSTKLLFTFYLVKEEEAARSARKDKNVLSVEDVKKDFVKLQDQSNYLEDKIVTLQKMTESNGIESKNKGEVDVSNSKIFILF